MNIDKALIRGLGLAIKSRRAQIGLSSADVADELGVSHSTVKMWELARSSPPFGKTGALAEALGLSTVELVKLACKLGGCQ